MLEGVLDVEVLHQFDGDDRERSGENDAAGAPSRMPAASTARRPTTGGISTAQRWRSRNDQVAFELLNRGVDQHGVEGDPGALAKRPPRDRARTPKMMGPTTGMNSSMRGQAACRTRARRHADERPNPRRRECRPRSWPDQLGAEPFAQGGASRLPPGPGDIGGAAARAAGAAESRLDVQSCGIEGEIDAQKPDENGIQRAAEKPGNHPGADAAHRAWRRRRIA